MTPSDLLYASLLIACLDSPKFDARQAASIGLERLGDGALPALILHERSHDLSPEQRRRLETALLARLPGRLERMFARFSPTPWIDASRAGWVCGPHLRLAGTIPPAERCELLPWSDCRVATRLWLTDIAYQRSIDEAENMLRRMWLRCQNWDGKGSPPPELP